MTAFQRVEEASHHNPETGNVLIQQLYRDWYNADAHLAAAEVRLSLIRLYQHEYTVLDRDIDNFRASRSWLAGQHGEKEANRLPTHRYAQSPTHSCYSS